MNASYYCGKSDTVKRHYGTEGEFPAIVCPWVIALNWTHMLENYENEPGSGLLDLAGCLKSGNPQRFCS